MYSKVALSIGGSDSGGGAGIQADLRTFMALKVHGCTVISCITAQNSLQVIALQAVNKATFNAQFDALFSDFKINSIKTGMLLNSEIIEDTSKKLEPLKIPKIIDPVMVSRTGATLLEQNAIDSYKKLLFPQAELITPNIFEAQLLTNISINTESNIEEAGKKLLDFGAKAVLVKGGGIEHLKGNDFYIDAKGESNWFKHETIATKNTHGSGCTLSAAICGYRSLGFDLKESIEKSKCFITKSLQNSYKIGSGPGPLGHI